MRKSLLTSLMIATTLMFACKRTSVTSTSSLRDTDATVEPAANEKGACVVYHKETKKVQATCFGDRTVKECNDSFKMVYEDVAPGKYQHEFIAKTNCETGKKQVEENLNDGSVAANPNTLSSDSNSVSDSKCVCAAFVQKKADKRHCLVARRKSSTTDSVWEAIAELSNDSDCEKQCGVTTGAAAKALKSTACRN